MIPSRIPLRKRFLSTINEDFKGYHNAVGETVNVSFPDAGDMIVAQTDSDKPLHRSQNSEDLQLKITQGGPRRYRSSSRIDSLAKPLARLQKPLIRPKTAFRGNLTLAPLKYYEL